MQRGPLTDIAGAVPKEVDGHLICTLFPKHLLQQPRVASRNSQNTDIAESGMTMQIH